MANRLVIILSIFAAMLLLSTVTMKSTSRSDGSNFFTRPDRYLLSFDRQLHAKLAHAESLWQQAVDDRETMISESGLDKNFPDGYIYPYNVWDFARPSFFCPHDLERVGTLGDGGKVVCGMTRYERESPGPSTDTNTAQELIVYSFGVSHDSSFEAALLQRTNARIWGYDYSVDSWAKEVPGHQYSRASFKQLGISGETNTEGKPPMSTIKDLMTVNGHSYIDVVKMDIEGAEFDALTSLINSIKEEQGDYNATLPFGQLLVEIHFMNEPPGFSIPQDLTQWLQWWSSLEDMGLRPVNNEDNWIGDVGSGKPRFMEYTLINALDKDRNKLLWA
ncbi:aminopeptidase Y [Purpureocillium lavendulum]|uniref:Aminopeptidase Y n=1 Tax=Purpureocillium lavendulum TaxID=1247861 RepID=A0AB34FX76_9HYPO|nr:aminopeptidase Y [Purpureocillium lavendulum]